jgi:hypothetical protein
MAKEAYAYGKRGLCIWRSPTHLPASLFLQDYHDAGGERLEFPVHRDHLLLRVVGHVFTLTGQQQGSYCPSPAQATVLLPKGEPLIIAGSVTLCVLAGVCAWLARGDIFTGCALPKSHGTSMCVVCE